MSTREKILKLIEEQGPADATRIAELLGSTRSSTRKLLMRMVDAGLLETFPNAPFAYYIAYQEQTSPTADDASEGGGQPNCCTG